MPREFGECSATTLSPGPAAFSKSVKTFAKKSLLGHTFRGKMLSLKGATKKIIFGNNFYMPRLTSFNKVTRRNIFRPKQKAPPLLCGIWCTSKNRIFICIICDIKVTPVGTPNITTITVIFLTIVLERDLHLHKKSKILQYIFI